MEKLFDLWAKRNPQWEKKFDESVMQTFTDYGKGTSQYLASRGKIYGAGYEMYIIAFFIGLYFDRTRQLVEDASKRKTCGQAIQYWGKIETRGLRQTYSSITKYIFVALIAKTDIDLIALEKGESKMTVRKAVDMLIDKMEQYANYGFYYIEEKLGDDPNYFFKENAFFKTIYSFVTLESEKTENDNEEELESLD